MNRFINVGLALLVVTAVGLTGCGGDDNGGNPTDNDNGSNIGGTNCTSAENCRQVTINGQIWMAENLNIKTANSWCYGNSAANCEKYGRLYTWDAAMKACPKGWHLPSRDEWYTLLDYVGEPKQILWATNTDTAYYWPSAGTKLKSTSGWVAMNGTDDFEFSALPSGDCLDSIFNSIGTYGTWWGATTSGTFRYHYSMSYGRDDVFGGPFAGDFGYSVRCIRDE